MNKQAVKEEYESFMKVVEAYTFIIETNRTYTFVQFAKAIERVYSMGQPRNKLVYDFLILNRGRIQKNRLGDSKIICSFPLTFNEAAI